MEKIDLMYCDKGEFKSYIGDKGTREYSLWQGIRARCFRNSSKKDAGYKDCTVDPRFYGFQAFAAWVTKQIGFYDGFQLDKDLLVKGNRTYGPDQCIFLPHEINSSLIKNSGIRGDLPIGVLRNAGQAINPFRACISISQRNRRIGSYETPNEAFLAYKEAKESAIKELAHKYKHAIDPRAFAALINYQVEITD